MDQSNGVNYLILRTICALVPKRCLSLSCLATFFAIFFDWVTFKVRDGSYGYCVINFYHWFWKGKIDVSKIEKEV